MYLNSLIVDRFFAYYFVRNDVVQLSAKSSSVLLLLQKALLSLQQQTFVLFLSIQPQRATTVSSRHLAKVKTESIGHQLPTFFCSLGYFTEIQEFYQYFWHFAAVSYFEI